MNKFRNLFQKYRQAAWRTQRQWVGLALILVVAIIMVSILYLGVAARTALTGRSIQSEREIIFEIERTNSDLETKYANLTSTEVTQQRAKELGFTPAEPEDRIFVSVPGFAGEPEFRPVPSMVTSPATPILPEYTESLIEWLGKTISSSSANGVQR